MAELGLGEHVAQRLRQLGGALDDLLTHRDVANAARISDALVAFLETGPQRLGFLGASLEGRRRRSARHHEQDRAQRIVVSAGGGGVVGSLGMLGGKPRRDILVAELEARLEAAANDLAPDQIGLHARFERFGLEALLAKDCR